MPRKKKSRRKRFKKNSPALMLVLVSISIIVSVALGAYLFNLMSKAEKNKPLVIDPNEGVEELVHEFFHINDAPEMIAVIRCESYFRHFNSDGSVLKNTAGSSATGVAQILDSKHPDPAVLNRYNKKFGTSVEATDFDIHSLEGNLDYALVLYQVNGLRDWECAQKFRFKN